MSSKELTPSVASMANCVGMILEILANARDRALHSVNAAMVSAYWEIGREIVEEEQRGSTRAEYGTQLLQQIARQLTADFGKGFGERNLRYIRQFYLTYADRMPPIRHSLSSESLPMAEAQHAGHSEPGERPRPLSTDLSWTHYRVLIGVANQDARSFYEVECAKAGWSVRELQRQIASLLFERLARSRDREAILALAREGHEVNQASDLVKDPYVLEFVGLPESSRWLESELEEASTRGPRTPFLCRSVSESRLEPRPAGGSPGSSCSS